MTCSAGMRNSAAKPCLVLDELAARLGVVVDDEVAEFVRCVEAAAGLVILQRREQDEGPDGALNGERALCRAWLPSERVRPAVWPGRSSAYGIGQSRPAVRVIERSRRDYTASSGNSQTPSAVQPGGSAGGAYPTPVGP